MNEVFEGQSSNIWGSLEGRVLVASKAFDGSPYEKSLIYVCAHDETGVIGVMINREVGHFTLKEIFEECREHIRLPLTRLNKRLPVLCGGPFEAGRIMILSMNSEQEKHFPKWHSLTVHTDPERFLRDYISGSHNNKFIVTKGLAAWDGRELEQQLEENSWLVMDVDDPKLIFSQRSKNKWKKVIDALGVRNFDNLVSYSGNA